MKFFKILILSCLAFTIVACTSGQYSMRKGNYLKQSKTVHPIVIPPGTMAPEQKPYYPVPNRSVHVTAKQAPSLKPPNLQ